jgi:hypothetical protein
MKNILKVAAAVVVAAALTQSVKANLASGSIGFAGTVTYDSSSAATATAVTSWINPVVFADTGAFSSITPGTHATFTTMTWNFLTTPPGITSFWTVGGFTFQLISSSVFSHGGTPGVNGFVVVDGTGTVTGNGYDATTLSWSFTSQDPVAGSNPAQWTFSASANSVPDGGATVMLLGLALSGAALLKKKLTA